MCLCIYLCSCACILYMRVMRVHGVWEGDFGLSVELGRCCERRWLTKQVRPETSQHTSTRTYTPTYPPTTAVPTRPPAFTNSIQREREHMSSLCLAHWHGRRLCLSRSSKGRPNSDRRRRGSNSARYLACATLTLKREITR